VKEGALAHWGGGGGGRQKEKKTGKKKGEKKPPHEAFDPISFTPKKKK